MNEPSPRTAIARRIEELDRSLSRDPDAFGLLLERAGLLRERGRFDEAKRDYLELLRRASTDFAVLNDFGTMVLAAGFKDAALSLFGEAVRHHPGNPNGHINLANLLFATGEHELARTHFEIALQLDPDHVHAHRGLGNLLAEQGDMAGARIHHDKAYANNFQVRLPYRGDSAPITVLLLISATGGNIPTGTILDDRRFQVTVLVAEYADPQAPMPPHDFVFNSIGDADLCPEGLKGALAIVARTDRPVINHPSKVLKTGRAANAARLRGLPDVITPRMMLVERKRLTGADAAAFAGAQGFPFPFLLRAPGFHTGQHFVRVNDAAELAATAARIPSEHVYLIDELDARDGDGFYRKLRVMIIDRKIYPLHLAISRHWKVHYFRADMAASPQNRLHDAAFLGDMAKVVEARGMAALDRINAALDLDYCGVDFAVNAAGEILLFEANATMVMVPLAADPKWDYRRPAFNAVFAAIEAMLLRRAGEGRPGVRVA